MTKAKKQKGGTVMATYALLTQLTPATVKSPSTLRALEKEVSARVRRECPTVKWVASFAVLGPVDYLDLFEAPDAETAARVVMILRSFGHAETETWTLIPWDRFEKLIPE